jgi:hypothetical protein
MSKTAARTKPALWERVKAEVTRGSRGGKPGQWSARKAQLAVAEYKKRGGGYRGRKSSDNALAKWTREEWRTKSGKPSLETGERYLPAKAIKALSASEYAATTRAKRAGLERGEQFTSQPEKIAKKTKRYRRNGALSFLAPMLAVGAAWELGWWWRRRSLRQKTYELAAAEAKRLGRPLVVVGAPDGGVTSGYGCGDVTVDIVRSESCPNPLVADVTKPLPFADNSVVVFVSCVLEYVDNADAALAELCRASGGHMHVVRVEPWTLTSILYPGARRSYVRVPSCPFPRLQPGTSAPVSKT